MDKDTMTLLVVLAVILIVLCCVLLIYAGGSRHQAGSPRVTVMEAIFGKRVNDIISSFLDSDMNFRRKVDDWENLDHEFQMKEFNRRMDKVRNKLAKREAKLDLKVQKIAAKLGMNLSEFREWNRKAIENSMEIEKTFLLDKAKAEVERIKRMDDITVATYAKQFVQFKLAELCQDKMSSLLREMAEFMEDKPHGWEKECETRMKSFLVFERLKNEAEGHFQVNSGDQRERPDETTNGRRNRKSPLGDDEEQGGTAHFRALRRR
jgi:hypothetical protein